MRFDQPATTNPIDQGKVVGIATPRIDGPLKTTGTAPYAYEHHDLKPAPAVGLTPGFTSSAGQYLLHVSSLLHRFTPLLSGVYR